jgi:hypothetical protein
MDTPRLNFENLHNEKVNLINDNIAVLCDIKECDTIVPPRFFNSINDEVIKDYKLKIKLLDKNLKFVGKELKKEHKLQRKVEKAESKQERKRTIQKLKSARRHASRT